MKSQKLRFKQGHSTVSFSKQVIPTKSFVAGDVTMKMYDAMVLKRDIGINCKIDAKILETLKEGFVLRILGNTVNQSSLDIIADFVTKHELNMLFDNGVYFISNQILAPSEAVYLSE